MPETTKRNILSFLKRTDENKSKVKRTKKRKRIVIISVILIVCIIAGFFIYKKKKDSNSDNEITTATVKKGNVSVVISGTGTVEANEQYDITSLVEGEIIADYFQEGDVVNKDDLLYSIDTSDAQNSLSRSQISLDNANSSYQSAVDDANNLNVKSPINGTVTNVYVKTGDNVSPNGKIADVINSDVMTLTIPFISDDASSLHIGQSVTVKLDNSFYETNGTISKVSSGEIVNSYGVNVKNVEINVNNPGSIKEGDTATVVAGNVASNDAGKFTYSASETIIAEVGGKVASLPISVGDKVSKNSVVTKLTSDSVTKALKDKANSLKESQLSLENEYDKLDDYSIKAPISGTVLQKNSKAGDKIDKSYGNSSSTAMAIIADMSRLLFDMNVDELDVSKIKLGQEVEITLDAIEDVTYTGFVDKISMVGTSTNGVTSYPITIVINEPENIIPGMNVSANIVVESKENVLTVPVSAVQRGNMVYVKDSSANSGGKLNQVENSKDNSANQNGMKNNEVDKTKSSDNSSANNSGGIRRSHIPDGFRPVKVETGINDDNNIEIISGLNEGDIVYVTPSADSSSSNMPMMMGPGMGGAPGGGMGGAPSGNRNSGGNMR